MANASLRSPSFQATPYISLTLAADESDRLTAIWSRSKDMKTVVALLAEAQGHTSEMSDILMMLHREFDAIEAIANPPSPAE